MTLTFICCVLKIKCYHEKNIIKPSKLSGSMCGLSTFCMSIFPKENSTLFYTNERILNTIHVRCFTNKHHFIWWRVIHRRVYVTLGKRNQEIKGRPEHPGY